MALGNADCIDFTILTVRARPVNKIFTLRPTEKVALMLQSAKVREFPLWPDVDSFTPRTGLPVQHGIHAHAHIGEHTQIQSRGGAGMPASGFVRQFAIHCHTFECVRLVPDSRLSNIIPVSNIVTQFNTGL